MYRYVLLMRVVKVLKSNYLVWIGLSGWILLICQWK